MEPMAALRHGAREILRNQKEAMRGVVRGLSADALNWKPDAPETNSIAQMLSHALDAERYLLSAAVDVQVDRDRESHFRVRVDSANELLELIDRIEREVDGYLAQFSTEHIGAEIARPNRTHTGAWWLLHAIEHSNEHVGQALLTRQMYEAANAG